MKKKIAVITLLCFLFTLMPVAAFAGDEMATSGTCGENATWNFDAETGTLTISGTGEIVRTASYWDELEDQIVNVVICEGITDIGDEAFSGCNALTNITIPKGIISIGDSAFRYCESLISIVLPEGVTSIGEYAFNICHSLTSITIPKSIESIGCGAFAACDSLDNVVIPEGITSIESWVFGACKSLSSINIPEDVTSIGEYAFYECLALNEIMIPDGVTSIADYTFLGCTSLEKVIIPESVINIGKGAFNGCSVLNSVNIPKNITEIEDGVFCGCRSLKDIVIPECVTNIGEFAFADCDSLTSVVIPCNIEKAAFSECDNLSQVSFFNDVQIIGDFAFKECNRLKDVVLPTSLESIGTEAFCLCSSIEKIDFPNNVEVIDERAFLYCEKLQGIILPDNVKQIGNRAFKGCKGDEILLIPNSVAEIGAGAFSSWVDLKTINVAVENVNYVSDDGVLYSKNANGKLDNIMCYPAGREGAYCIPDGVKAIEDYAFYDCLELIDIEIPRSVTSIGEYAFSNCKSLRYINIPEGTTVIKKSAFEYTTIDIVFPNSLERIEDEVFDWSTHVKNVFYVGSEADWLNVLIGERNNIADANFHYNATDHSYGELIPAQSEVHTPTELKAGIATHYQCDVCETYFTEEKVETTLSALEGDIPWHSYDNGWKKDASGHWRECECGAKNNFSEHQSDGPATEDYAEVCYICGWEINPIVNHTHTFSNDWSNDATYHWHAATCGHNVVSDKAEHNDGTTKDYKCDVCGRALSTAGDNTGSGTTPDSGSTGSGTGSGNTGNTSFGSTGSGGGSSYTPSTSQSSDDVTINNANSNMSVETSEVKASVIGDAKQAVSKDNNTEIIGGVDCAVNITAEDKQGNDVNAFFTPLTVEIPLERAVLQTVDNISHLTLAKVVTDTNGNTSLVYMGGNYDTQSGLFTAYVDEPGDYVLVEDADVKKIELQIGNRTTGVNGTDKTSDVAPRIIDNHTYVPLRYIAEILGCDVAWDEATRTVTITQNGIAMKLVIDETISGYGVSAVIRENRTLVPLRYIAEQLGANVIWHPETQEIVIAK